MAKSATKQADVQTNNSLTKAKKKRTILAQSTLPLHIMLIPGVIFVLVYSYAPMLGVIIAFQDFNPMKCDGSMWSLFFGSPWASNNGMANFLMIFNNASAVKSIVNTIIISVWKIVTMFFSPIILALLLNEVRKSWLKRSVQTIVYLPHFLSWVILAGIIVQLLSREGIVNTILRDMYYNDPTIILNDFGAQLEEFKPITFLQDKDMFRPIIIITNIWKEIGWSTIIYLAAISGVDPTLYEAAVMDGANKFKQCIHVTIPGMTPIIVLSLVLSLQGVLNAGFDQIFNLYNVQTYDTGDIIDTFVYRVSFKNGNYSLGAAVGLFKSIISLILITVSYWMAGKFANYEIF